jgi:hypothetical protein
MSISFRRSATALHSEGIVQGGMERKEEEI